jgi:signal transduction histidine kinase
VRALLQRDAPEGRLEREADQIAAQLAAIRARGERIDTDAVNRLAHVLEVRLPDGTQLRGGRVADGNTAESVIRLSVEDHGAGIRDTDGPRIFERGVSPASGSGLGLAVARELAHAGGSELRLAHLHPPRFELSMPAGR